MKKTIYDAKNKIWSGPKIDPLFNPNQSLGYLILNVLQHTPNLITQLSADSEVSVTCSEMYDRTVKIAKYLIRCGIKTGDKAGFIVRNTENVTPTLFACFVLGLPINPLTVDMLETDIVRMYSVFKPKVIFCDAENLSVVQNAINEMKSDAQIITIENQVSGYECLNEILKEMKNECTDDFIIPCVDPDSTAIVLCSSGSTGYAKGISKSHRHIIHGFYPHFSFNSNGPTIVFQINNLFWFSGIYFIVIGVLYKCTRIITIQTFEPKLYADIINKYKVNNLMITTYGAARILQVEGLKAFESINEYMIVGSPYSNEFYDSYKKFIPNGVICNGYGCTEQNYIAVNKGNFRNGSCGLLMKNVEIKIMDDNSNPLGPNERGEIWSKIPVQFTDYFGDPQKTKESFEGDWFKTGDIGYFDDDGHLYFVDRKKDLLKYQNFHVWSAEIEAIINEIKGVISSCVVGVYNPENGNDIIHAFVIVETLSDVTENSIIDYVHGKVADHKKLRGGVHIVDAFPSTFSGKANKIELKKIASEMGKC